MGQPTPANLVSWSVTHRKSLCVINYKALLKIKSEYLPSNSDDRPDFDILIEGLSSNCKLSSCLSVDTRMQTSFSVSALVDH